ncbi:MAG: ATP-binding protein, partial [Promethearchaeota archaeon]
MKENSKHFDLNIEKILEDWQPFHAIREVLANALDEQLLTNTKDIEIFKDEEGAWHVRDFGRGLQYQHLTQKENDEKLKHEHVIGKFGIGLKDALATFERHGKEVEIRSKHNTMRVERTPKDGFSDIITLHVTIESSLDPSMEGTDFIIYGIDESEIAKAKNLFLKFSGGKLLETTEYGEVLEKASPTAGRIYVNGGKVAEEENFLFDYNITNLTKKIKKALNRERTNVGRSAYSDRIKNILLRCKTREVANQLVKDMSRFHVGNMHDELAWIDVQEHATKIIQSSLEKKGEKVAFFTPTELQDEPSIVNHARKGGYTIITIPERLSERVQGKTDDTGAPIRNGFQFKKEFSDSYKFDFVKPDELTPDESRIFRMTGEILELAGISRTLAKKVKISNT